MLVFVTSDSDTTQRIDIYANRIFLFNIYNCSFIKNRGILEEITLFQRNHSNAKYIIV